jgi:hypothetical protein
MVVPVVYSLVDGGKEGFRERFMRGEPGEEEPAAPPPEPAAVEGS